MMHRQGVAPCGRQCHGGCWVTRKRGKWFQFVRRFQIPQAQCLVAAAGQQLPGTWKKSNAANGGGVAKRRLQLLRRLDVEDLQGVGLTRRADEAPAVREERQSTAIEAGPLKTLLLLLRVPEANAVAAAAQEILAVRREGETSDFGAAAEQFVAGRS